MVGDPLCHLDQQAVLQRLDIVATQGQKRMDEKVAALEQERDRKINEIETNLAVETHRVQFWYKLWAVVVPPIAPLLLAVGVFVTRRVREREGVSRSRLRA